MPRIVPPVVALALFIGLGFATRHYFPIWLEGKLKESQEATAKEMGNWKPVQTNFEGKKFDSSMLTPQFDASKFNPPPVQPSRPKAHPVQ